MNGSGAGLGAAAIAVAMLAGCGGQNGAREAEGTSGRRTPATLSGCLERNTDTGNFVLVVDEKGQAAGLEPGSRLVLEKSSGEIELNQIVGRRVTLEGTLGPIDAIADAGTQTPVAGAGADPSQTREASVEGLRVTKVVSTGDTCALENR